MCYLYRYKEISVFYICFTKIFDILANILIYSRLIENPHEWHSKGQEFDSPMLHKTNRTAFSCPVFVCGSYAAHAAPSSNPPVATRLPPGARVRGLPRRASRAPFPFAV